MTSDEFTNWRKASYSAGNANCVAVAAGCQRIGVQDTTQHGRGLVLQFPVQAWQAFIADAKARRA